MAYRPARSGAEGNTRLQRAYGAGSTPPRQTYAKGYASGGAVKGDGPAMSEGLSASGSPAKPSLARAGRKMPGKGKKGGKGTNVNVIVMPKGDTGASMPMPPPGPGPMAGPPPGPPMPPPGAGGPPMRKHGGAVGRFAKGGRVKRADGGPTPGEQMQAARQRRDDAESSRNRGISSGLMSAGARAAMSGPGPAGKVYRALKAANTLFAGTSALGAAVSQGKKSAAEAEMKRLGEGRATEGEEDRKKGGRVNSDAKQDKAMMAKMVHKHEKMDHKGTKLTKFREGGPAITGFDAGAGGARGRLEKVRKYGK